MSTQNHLGSRLATSHKQRGGVAIEFALAFPLFFTLFYAIVGYGLVMTLEQSLELASKEAARAAIKVDPTAENYQNNVESEARNAAAATLNWLPQAQKDAILGSAPGYDRIQVSINGSSVTVTLTYPYTQSPLLPILTLPVVGEVPNLPDNLIGKAIGQL